MSSETTLDVIRAWALDGSACDLPEAKRSRMLSLNKDLVFGNGEEGGIVVKARTSAEQSFYLTDDEKSIVIQDLLEDLKVKINIIMRSFSVIIVRPSGSFYCEYRPVRMTLSISNFA